MNININLLAKKLLGHTKIYTTQIYGKIINMKKDDAIGLFDQAFE